MNLKSDFHIAGQLMETHPECSNIQKNNRKYIRLQLMNGGEKGIDIDYEHGSDK